MVLLFEDIASYVLLFMVFLFEDIACFKYTNEIDNLSIFYTLVITLRFDFEYDIHIYSPFSLSNVKRTEKMDSLGLLSLENRVVEPS